MYDYDIRKMFDDTLGEDAFFHINNNLNDYDTLRLAIEFLKIARDRLDNDLDNWNIRIEYDRLDLIIDLLENILKKYV